MNWTETIVGALTTLVAGLMMAREYTMKFISESGDEFLVSYAGLTSGITKLIVIGGIGMTYTDFFIMASLTLVSALVASGFTFKDWKSGLLNIGLGFMFGMIFAQVIIFVFRIDTAAFFGLAPCCGLFAARGSRGMIRNDAIVNALAHKAVQIITGHNDKDDKDK